MDGIQGYTVLLSQLMLQTFLRMMLSCDNEYVDKMTICSLFAAIKNRSDTVVTWYYRSILAIGSARLKTVYLLLKVALTSQHLSIDSNM